MLKNKVTRKGEFSPIPKHERNKAKRRTCSCCGAHYGQVKCYLDNHKKKLMEVRQVLDHMLPRRWLSEHGIYEHDHRGLLSICSRCHGKKKVLEDRLYQGDLYSFVRGLRVMNYPMERFAAFMRILHLTEFLAFAEAKPSLCLKHPKAVVHDDGTCPVCQIENEWLGMTKDV